MFSIAGINSKELLTVQSILKQFFQGYQVRVFGSRITDNFRFNSDLDLVVMGDSKIDFKVLGRAKEVFQESNLSFRVDLLDWQVLDPNFQEIINQKYEVIEF